MKDELFSMKSLAGAAGAAAVGLAMSTTPAFASADLDHGYQQAGGYTQLAEGACGEGTCGASDDGDKDSEGACGEGTCGGSDESDDKDSEGACGEGTCGG
ncbi:hypothetical protein [Thioalkalivibrio sp. ALJ24]|uniref:HvfA family oxazolone/thioamide-modified RiPP metallophore n=1 Tax=Thioalkalivibrio sp. ALJ24 TaxID=545276 RepID=UPI0003764924|nr:hypothetical protein [Thioalkalivibrio sp. ALJ24]